MHDILIIFYLLRSTFNIIFLFMTSSCVIFKNQQGVRFSWLQSFLTIDSYVCILNKLKCRLSLYLIKRNICITFIEKIELIKTEGMLTNN